MKRWMVAIAIVAAAAAATGCGDSGPVREVSVTMGPGMIFTPSEITGTVGERLLIKVVNADDTLDHDMVVAGSRVRLHSGQSGQLTVSLKKAGTQDIRCTLPGHTEAGMVGVLKVVAQ